MDSCNEVDSDTPSESMLLSVSSSSSPEKEVAIIREKLQSRAKLKESIYALQHSPTTRNQFWTIKLIIPYIM